MLIGLHGFAQSGKDTIYSFLKEDFESRGTKIVRDAFADRLKISAAAALGFDGTDEERIAAMNTVKISGRIATEFGKVNDEFVSITGREFLQRYGTEAHRDVFGQDFWTNAVLPDAWEDNYGRTDITDNDVLVITDVRFENEAERVLDCGGSIWHIKRDAVAKGDGHASEQELPPELITLTIENNTTLDALRAKVYHCMCAEMAANVRTRS